MMTLKNISKIFDAKGIAGLHHLSLSLNKGKVLALMGPNGSGKSTLLNIMNGTLKADSGEINISGRCLLINETKQIADMNVLKFLVGAVTLEMDEEKKIQLARDLADIFEFTFQLRQNSSDLSQGQRQKMLLCSELMNRPEIILLDEPFNHLDPYSRKEILNGLFRYIRQQELSVVWVTHDRNEAFHFADEIAILNFGKIEQHAKPPEIMLNPNSFFVAQFLGHQNFILCKRQDSDTWITPWGPWQTPSALKADEALMVIPPYAWVVEAGPFEVEVQSLKPHNLQWEIEFTWNEQKFIAHFPFPEKIWLEKSPLYLKPVLKNCFLLAL